MKTWTWVIAVALLGLSLGVGIAWLNRPGPAAPGSEGAGVGEPHPGFRLGGLDGEWIDADDYEGQVLLVNFWATWCAPCVKEMPMLQETAASHSDLTVVGIAVDEPARVRDFVDELGIGYPVAVGAADVLETQRRWGNASGALPYTVLVDAQGIIRWQHLGEVKADQLTAVLDEWL